MGKTTWRPQLLEVAMAVQEGIRVEKDYMTSDMKHMRKIFLWEINVFFWKVRHFSCGLARNSRQDMIF